MATHLLFFSIGLSGDTSDAIGLRLYQETSRREDYQQRLDVYSSRCAAEMGADVMGREIDSFVGPRLIVIAFRHDRIGTPLRMLRLFQRLYTTFRLDPEVQFRILMPIPNVGCFDHFDSCQEV